MLGKRKIHLYTAIAVAVCFIIGFPLWLIGCDPEVPGGCTTRVIEPGNVTRVKIKSGMCCKTKVGCLVNNCCAGGYKCFTPSLEIDSKPGHCAAEMDGAFQTSQEAQFVGEAIGNFTTILIDPRTRICTIYLHSYQRYWITGVTFLCLTLSICLGWSIYYMKLKVQKNRENREIPTIQDDDNNNEDNHNTNNQTTTNMNLPITDPNNDNSSNNFNDNQNRKEQIGEEEMAPYDPSRMRSIDITSSDPIDFQMHRHPTAEIHRMQEDYELHTTFHTVK